MAYKTCFIPCCRNTTTNSEKLFVTVPRTLDKRIKWFNTFRDGPCGSDYAVLYCCEDHFDLEKDAANWVHFKMLGCKIRLHPYVVPHKYLHVPNEDSFVSQFTSFERNSKVERLKLYNAIKYSEANKSAERLKMEYVASLQENQRTIDINNVSTSKVDLNKNAYIVIYTSDTEQIDDISITKNQKLSENINTLMADKYVTTDIVQEDSTSELNKAIEHDHSYDNIEVLAEQVQIKEEKIEMDAILNPNNISNNTFLKFEPLSIKEEVKAVESYSNEYIVNEVLEANDLKLGLDILPQAICSHKRRDVLPQGMQGEETMEFDVTEGYIKNNLDEIDIHFPSKSKIGNGLSNAICDLDYIRKSEYNILPLENHSMEMFQEPCIEPVTSNDLIEHTAEKFKLEFPYECAVCNDLFSEVRFRDTHMLIHDSSDVLSIKDELIEQFKEKESHIEQIDIIEDSNDITMKSKFTLNCKICNELFSEVRFLDNHMSMIHNCEPQFTCHICNEKFFNFSAYKFHVQKVACKQLDICRMRTSLECDFKSNSAGTSMKPNDINKHECSICFKRFTKKGVLRDHMRRHIPKSIECAICHKKFKETASLIVHMRIHNNERLYECNQCPKTYVILSALTAHMKLHKDKNIYKCDICSKQLESHSGFKAHMLRHTSEPNFECGICKKSFYTAYDQKKHMRRHITLPKENRFKCTICSKSFKTQTYCNLHITLHDRPHKCDKCNKRFMRLQNLEKHKILHEDEPDSSMKCDICNKSFKYITSHKKHMEAHNGKRRKRTKSRVKKKTSAKESKRT